jgi:hypothetical protein
MEQEKDTDFLVYIEIIIRQNKPNSSLHYILLGTKKNSRAFLNQYRFLSAFFCVTLLIGLQFHQRERERHIHLILLDA